MTPYGFIYITTNMINGKRYLGMCAYHRQNHKTYLGSGKALKRAVRKYGNENFSRVITEECLTKDDMIAAEVRHIKELDCVSDKSWYNINHGGFTTKGFSGRKHSEETKQKIRDNYKRPIYDSTRIRMQELGRARISNLTNFIKDYYARGGVGLKAKAIIVEGVEYTSITNCIKLTGYSFYKIKKLMKFKDG